MEVRNVRHENVVESGAVEGLILGARPGRWQVWVEATMAAAAFVTMCVVTLSVAPQSAEPDDGAYRASIVGVTEGHFLTLSRAQAQTLASSLHDNPAAPPNQWVQVAPGRYISEKDPGYPYLAAGFERLGIIRWAPLFFGLVGCLGLFVGARRWLGPFGGAAAVGLYCSSGAALAFAWRDYMPTFTDTSLIAAGCGLLLWALLATEAGSPRRTWMGLTGFLALESATFVRYTNVVILACAVLAVLAAWRMRAAALPPRTLWWWLSSVAAFGIGVAAFDTVVYGGPLTTGYQPGEVTFALRAIGPNLRLMPTHLLQAMPVLVLGAASVLWIVGRWAILRRASGAAGFDVHEDLRVALGLAATWLTIWGLYASYTWTTDLTNATVQVVRFYLPALGPIAILAAWLVTRVPGRDWLTGIITAATITLLFAQGALAFHSMYAAFGVPLNS
jgi:hypothetical protein